MDIIRKFVLIAAGVIAITGTANASLDSVVNATIFMSGSSSSSNMLREHVVRNICNKTLPITVFVDGIRGGTGVSTALPLIEHITHWVVQCTANSTAGTNLIGKTIAVYKSDANGSGNGTTTVVNSVAVPFLDADTTNCSLFGTKAIQNAIPAASYNLYLCAAGHLVNQIPDGGVSDVEPDKFRGTLAPASGNFVDNGNLNIRYGPGLIFGIAVTKALRNALQSDQFLTADAEDEANMPDLPPTYITSVTQGKVQLWNSLPIYGNTLTVPATFAGADGMLNGVGDVTPTGINATLKPFLHLCRRVQGSGTHAEYMIHYHYTNCLGSGSGPMPGQPGCNAGKPCVFENSSSGNMGLCLDHLDKGDGYSGSIPPMAPGRASYGIGFQSLEKNQSNGENWRFVKIAGYAPTRKNVFDGSYKQVYFSSFQYRNDNSYATGPLRTATSLDVAAVNEFYNTNLNINQAVVADINQGFQYTWGGAGFVIPTKTAPVTFSVADPRIPWCRERNPAIRDSCQGLSLCL